MDFYCTELRVRCGGGVVWNLYGEKKSFQATLYNYNSSTHVVEHDLPKLNRNSVNNFFKVETTSRSYFAKNKKGSLIPEQRNGKKFYQVGEDVYKLYRTFNTNKTALIVMDPWEDNGSSFLNDYYEPVVREKLIPLIEKSINLRIPVIVLTNSPLKSHSYGNKVVPKIESLAKQGKVHIIYHQSTDSIRFSDWLRYWGIDTLIYSGFASNVCLIGLDLGMITMKKKGFRLFFVPEASAAVEFQDSWKNNALHESTTIMISQWIGELINLNNFLFIPEILQR